MSTKLEVLVLVLLLCMCASCDTGWPFSALPLFQADFNFAWSEQPGDPFHSELNGIYYQIETDYYAILLQRGTGLGAGSDSFVLFCLRKESRDTGITYHFKHGMVLITGPHLGGAQINRKGFLKGSDFNAGQHTARSIRLEYNGEVLDEMSKLYGEINVLRWMRFEVTAKENRDKVISIVQELYPLLEKETDTSDILACLKPLLQDKSP